MIKLTSILLALATSPAAVADVTETPEYVQIAHIKDIAMKTCHVVTTPQRALDTARANGLNTNSDILIFGAMCDLWAEGNDFRRIADNGGSSSGQVIVRVRDLGHGSYATTVR